VVIKLLTELAECFEYYYYKYNAYIGRYESLITINLPGRRKEVGIYSILALLIRFRKRLPLASFLPFIIYAPFLTLSPIISVFLYIY
jgi:hypothetical protein